MDTLDKYFPGVQVKSIVLSHKHFDHSELAPELQKAIGEKQGSVPDVRIHRDEKQNAITRQCRMGQPLVDGDMIGWTDFKVLHMPGHTPGTVGLVDEKDKILISPVRASDNRNLVGRMAFMMIDWKYPLRHRNAEKLDRFEEDDYKLFYTHPKL